MRVKKTFPRVFFLFTDAWWRSRILSHSLRICSRHVIPRKKTASRLPHTRFEFQTAYFVSHYYITSRRSPCTSYVRVARGFLMSLYHRIMTRGSPCAPDFFSSRGQIRHETRRASSYKSWTSRDITAQIVVSVKWNCTYIEREAISNSHWNARR